MQANHNLLLTLRNDTAVFVYIIFFGRSTFGVSLPRGHHEIVIAFNNAKVWVVFLSFGILEKVRNGKNIYHSQMFSA